MDLDPDIALPSVEPGEEVVSTATPRQSNFARNVSRSTGNSRQESSPSRTPFKTSRSRQTTPGPTSISRSSSVASTSRNGRSTPTLDKKRSIPNLTIPQSSTPHQPQFRRASSNLNPATPIRTKSLERPKTTPASVAKDYFRKELGIHSQTNSEVAVYTHDACYGHRFSRPKSSKATLASIVERPERIHAALLGASTAYVRLGGRHKDGRYGPNLDLDTNAVPDIPFTVCRTTRSIPLNHAAVTSVHGAKWMEGLQIMCDTAEANLAMGRKELTRPMSHTKDGKGNTLPALHSGDLYLSSESLAALQGCLGGVFDAVDTVFQSEITKRAFVCIRPPGHHCSADMPSGFCWLNNVHVGISYAAMTHGLTHAVIIDFDLHHGDGSQTITWQHNHATNAALNPKSIPAHKKIPIGYYSLHDINSYPCEYGDEDKVRNASTCIHTAHGQSIWNVHLESWKSHADFWDLYRSKYSILLEKAQAFLQHHSYQLRECGIQPKAAIFLSSGFDASEWETEHMQRHQVNVPTDFYAKFTHDVVNIANQSDLGVDGRIVSVLEGGYSDRALASGILSHICGLASSVEDARENVKIPPGLGGLTSTNPVPTIPTTPTYDPLWWSQEHLELLEAMVAGNLPPPIVKSKDNPLSNYTSPTQASSARMTENAKERASISAQLEARLLLENAPPEPIPEVDWVTAAYELSRLLIPSDRQIDSCTHEELNAENSRARRDRQSLNIAPPTDIVDPKMQLRDRKAKVANMGVPQSRAVRSSSRRTTIAAASDLPDPSALEAPRTRRRSSASSSVLSGFHNMRLDERDTELPSQNSSRVSSVVPTRPPAPAPVRKARAPAVKKPASTTSSPRKARTVKEAVPATSKLIKPSPVLPTTSRISEQDTTTASTAANSSSMDELTNGMKKISIKLKMPTQGVSDERSKSSEEPTKTKTRISKKPTIPKAANTKAPTVQDQSIPVGHRQVSQSESNGPSSTGTASAGPSSHTGVSSPVHDASHVPAITNTIKNETTSVNDSEVMMNDLNEHKHKMAEIEKENHTPSPSQKVTSPYKQQKPPAAPSPSRDGPKKTARSSFVPEIPRFDEWMEQTVMYPTISLQTESTSSSLQDSSRDKMDDS